MTVETFKKHVEALEANGKSKELTELKAAVEKKAGEGNANAKARLAVFGGDTESKKNKKD